MAQITRVTSEALQATIRRLLPSQQGFGEDLEASNVITPIIDLTPTAEGSSVPQMLQTAIAFGSNTSFEIVNGVSDIANTAGFYRIFGTCTIPTASTVDRSVRMTIENSGVFLDIYQVECDATGTGGIISQSFDFVIFLQPGEIARAVSDDTDAVLCLTIRQIADSGGNLINPVGFTPQ